MAKRTKSITMKLNRDGSITMKSTGGVDLRKYVPQLFEQPAATEEAPAPAPRERGDLVGRLRSAKTHMSHGRDMVEQQWPASDLEIEAAREIERLRQIIGQSISIAEGWDTCDMMLATQMAARNIADEIRALAAEGPQQ